MSLKLARSFAVVASAALLVGAFGAAPADAKKKKKPKKCAPYATPSWAEGAETTIVTHKATTDAPVEVTIATEPGLGFTSADTPGGGDGLPSAAYHNIVVDSAKPSAKLLCAWSISKHGITTSICVRPTQSHSRGKPISIRQQQVVLLRLRVMRAVIPSPERARSTATRPPTALATPSKSQVALLQVARFL